MATKLNWEYQDTGKHAGEYHAEHNGYRIRAVLDQDVLNPLNDDGHWPMLVRDDGRVTLYEKTAGFRADDPLSRISDAQLVHDQITIAKLLSVKIEVLTALVGDYGPRGVKYCDDGGLLREQFQNILDDQRESEKFETYAELFKLAGIHAYCADSCGHSQGDRAEVLVVATPEAIEEFGCTEVTDDDLAEQVKLYGAWAWGDVYGYVIERVQFEDDSGDNVVVGVEEIDSCWGFYGSDFDWSGLEDAAMEACPDEEKIDA
jgi:hypothetical protein